MYEIFVILTYILRFSKKIIQFKNFLIIKNFENFICLRSSKKNLRPLKLQIKFVIFDKFWNMLRLSIKFLFYHHFSNSTLSIEYSGSGVDFQSIKPYYVATKMTANKLQHNNEYTTMIPSAKEYSRQALGSVGRFVSTHGYVPHCVQSWLAKLSKLTEIKFA